MRKHIIIISALLLLTAALNAQTITKSGTTSAQFLKIGMDARGTAMGDAATATTSDGSAVFWNPAGLSYVTRGGISANYLEWIAGIKSNSLTLSYPVPNIGTVGVFVTSLTIPQDEVTTVTQPEGTGEFFDGSDFAVGLSYARQVTDRFSFGVTSKFVQERIWTMSASSFAVDVGSIYHSNWRNFRIGFVLRNFGAPMKFSGRANLITTDPDPVIDGNNEYIRAELEMEEWDLPMHLTTSFAVDVFSTSQFASVLAVDMVHPNDNVEFFNVGVEIGIMDMIYLRGGSRHIGQENPVGTTALGGGLKIPIAGQHLSLDYSLTDFGPLKNVSQFSLYFSF